MWNGRTIAVSSFIAACFLSLLCDLYYNFQVYEIENNNTAPTLLTAFFLIVMLVVSIALILIIHNSFAVSMDAKVHQLGILSSVGATPGQIRLFLIREAASFCILPVFAGCLISIPLTAQTIAAANRLAADVPGREEAFFHYHPFLFLFTAAAAWITVLISAWIPARKLSKLTPLEAIKGGEELHLKKESKKGILPRIFGIEGELAQNAVKAQKKTLRTSTLSFVLSFLGFSTMLCFFTLSGISTNHTYFERYQNAWDVMITVKNTSIHSLKNIQKIRETEGVGDLLAYQKSMALCFLPKSAVSDEVNSLGGLKSLAENSVSEEKDGYMVNAPLIIMDDASFLAYCKELGVSPEINGSIVLNQIWDSADSNFRYKKFIPFIKEQNDRIKIQKTKTSQDQADIPILAYTREAPALREEYQDYSLVQFISASFWEKISPQIGSTDQDTYVRILGEKNASLASLTTLEMKIVEILRPDYSIESENRLEEKITDERMRKGYMVILGAFLGLLASIGIANVFFNTLGFVRQRNREFSRYMSIGMTPESLAKMLFVEALITAGRPALITIPLTVILAGGMVKLSYLDPAEFLAKAPVFPMAMFYLAVFSFVALAYYIGGKRITPEPNHFPQT